MSKAIKAAAGPQEPTALYRMQVRMIVRIARLMNRFLDNIRVIDALADADIIGEAEARYFPRLRECVRDMWDHRIVITRRSTLDQIRTSATIAGIRHAAEDLPFNVTEMSIEPIEGHASRTTQTGKVLVSV